MTNLQAFMLYFSDEGLGTLILTNNGLTPGGDTNTELASAFGMWEKVKQADYSQGTTSERLGVQASNALRRDALRIFAKFGIQIQDQEPTISCEEW